MVLLDYDKVVLCKFLIPAGSVESCLAVSATFQQYRCSLFDKFVSQFNKETNFLPSDLLLPTLVYIPLQGVFMENIIFEIKMPSNNFLFKKVFKISELENTNLLCFDVNVLNLFKLVLIKSFLLKYSVLNIYFLKTIFNIYYNCFSTYTSIAYRKFFFFSIFFLKGGYNVIFYNIEIFKSFYYFFK